MSVACSVTFRYDDQRKFEHSTDKNIGNECGETPMSWNGYVPGKTSYDEKLCLPNTKIQSTQEVEKYTQ